MANQNRNKKVNQKSSTMMFEEAVTTEIQKLAQKGVSTTLAAQRVRLRITGANESTLNSACSVRAADLAERHQMTSEEAFNAIAVSKEVKSLRVSGLSRQDVMSLLVERAKKVDGNHASASSPSSLVPQVEVKRKHASISSSMTSSSNDCDDSYSGSDQLSIKPLPPSPVAHPSSSPSLANRSISSLTTTAPSQFNLPSESFVASSSLNVGQSCPIVMKRSRSGDVNKDNQAIVNKIAVAKEVESEVDVELSRTLTGLSGQINEAMRSGDRSKVALLMRQRDQLRMNKGASITETEAASSTNTKRSKPNNRTSQKRGE